MKTEIDKAAEVIQNGGVILYPTDTIWGLGCDPKNEKAVQKIFDIKKRSDNKSMIVLVNSEQLLGRYVKEVPEVCFDLIDCATRPLTIVYPKGQYVSDKLKGEDDSLGIRITNDEFCKKLIQKLKSGIVSTSANVSGESNPENFDSVNQTIKDQVDYVVDLPQLSKDNSPSQIIKISAKGEIEIIRK
ncbi:MAG: L-threonylcarbamoyladenylate synthase [Arenicella sp.]